jgi:copper chaperone CopZ
VRGGFSLYEVDYDEIQPWLIVEARRMRGLSDKTEITPMVRLIHNRYFVEFGSTTPARGERTSCTSSERNHDELLVINHRDHHPACRCDARNRGAEREGHRQRHGLRLLRAGHRKALSKLPATKAVFVDLKQKVVAVEAKDGQTLDGKTITAEIVDAGYDVVKLEMVDQPVAEIKASMKARK